MHISIHTLVKTYIENQESPGLYTQILKEAGIEQQHFEDEKYHNDTELNQVITAAGKVMSQSREEFLTNAGLDAAPGLLEAFKSFCDPDWNVLDLLEHIESRMHKHVREEMGAFPPALKPNRISESELEIKAKSHRKMAFLAKGFILGFAKEYGDEVEVTVDQGDNEYVFYVKKLS